MTPPHPPTFLKVWIFKGGWGVLGPISTLFLDIFHFFKNSVQEGPGGVEKIHTFNFFLKASLMTIINFSLPKQFMKIKNATEEGLIFI